MENEVPVTLTAETVPAIRNSGNFVDNFREAYKIAAALAKSSLIPQQYQGKVADCAIAIDMADRMGVSPLMGIQVQGEAEDSEPCQNNAQKLTAAIMGDNSGLLEDK